ncbi:MAG TPA: alpha/beta hydrolase [Pseudonocardiaceae bacterium]
MRKTLLAVGAAAAGALILGVPPALASPDTANHGLPNRYLTQQIDWQPCFDGELPPGLPPGSERLECGTFVAPLDWNRPRAGADVTVAVSRLRPANGEAQRSLFTNPGGPGGPGRTLPLVFLAAGRTKVLDTFEIVGIDPRGTGDSSNVTCGGLSIDPTIDPRDRSPENIRAMLDLNRLIARECQKHSGELGRHVTTEQTVRDLDLLRHLLGRDKISWVGYSGGSWMGAHYAERFPHRVDRFVLDSNTEFTTTWQKSFAWQPLGFERRFREDFLPWVARYDELYHLGSTAEQVRQSYERIRARLAEQPLDLGDGFLLTPLVLDDAIIGTLYVKSSFPILAQDLAMIDSLLTQPTAIEATATRETLRQQVVELRRHHLFAPLSGEPAPDAFEATFYSIICNDTPWKGDDRYLVRESEKQGRKYPLLGWNEIMEPCLSWDRPRTDLPRPDGKGVPPVLMVQSENDPATPMEGAVRAHRAFANSRMLTVTDEGDHGIYASGNACVDDVVEAYLVDGVVPRRDLTCPGLPLPDPTAATTLATTAENPLQAAERLSRIAEPLLP